MNDTITAVRGVEVGHWTSDEHGTGVSVLVFPEPNVAAAEMRGAAPGSRETALLGPEMRVQQIQALVFSGGSAFGLASADGVVQELAADGRGHPTRNGPVPIVPAAVVYDLDRPSGLRPGASEGARAYRDRSSRPVQLGRVGVGRGATISQWRGPGAVQPSGLGSASVEVDGVRVGGCPGSGERGGRRVRARGDAPYRWRSRPRPPGIRDHTPCQHHAGGGRHRSPPDQGGPPQVVHQGAGRRGGVHPTCTYPI